jgi:dephospho-CoA kinase
MKIAALTGGIGTGKSTVADIFKSLGALVVDSDAIARSYLSKGMKGYDLVFQRYGKSILDNGSEINRQKLAEIIFKDAEERKWLESIIHPYVFEQIKHEIDIHAEKDGIMIVDVPLLFEAGSDAWLRPVILVTCERDAQIRRIQQRNPEMSYEHIIERMHAQMPIEQKQKSSDFVIDNSKDIENTTKQVRDVWDILINPEKVNGPKNR